MCGCVYAEQACWFHTHYSPKLQEEDRKTLCVPIVDEQTAELGTPMEKHMAVTCHDHWVELDAAAAAERLLILYTPSTFLTATLPLPYNLPLSLPTMYITSFSL